MTTALSTDALSAVFSALADPTRRAILARLTQGDASVGELAAPFDLSLPTVSRHISVLEGARLVVRERDAQWRRCHFQPAPLMAAAEWIGRYVAFWDGRLDALSDLVQTLPAPAARGRKAPRASTTSRPSRKETR